MSRNRVVVMKIVSGELSVSAAAEPYRISRGQLHRLLARYRTDGLDGVDPRSRRPLSSPQGVSVEVREEIVRLRLELTGSGLDAGP